MHEGPRHKDTAVNFFNICSRTVYLRVWWTLSGFFTPLMTSGKWQRNVLIQNQPCTFQVTSTTSSQMSPVTEMGEFPFPHTHTVRLQQCWALEPFHSHRQLSEHPDLVQAAGGTWPPDAVPQLPLLAVICDHNPHPTPPPFVWQTQVFTWPTANSSRSGSFEQVWNYRNHRRLCLSEQDGSIYAIKCTCLRRYYNPIFFTTQH